MADLTLDDEPLKSSSSSSSAALHNGRRLHQCLTDILTDMFSAQSMLPYFIQYMDACDAMHLVEFWLAVESFRSGRDRSVTTLPSTHRHRRHCSPPSLSPSHSQSLSSRKDTTSLPLKDGCSHNGSRQCRVQTTEVVADGDVSACSNAVEMVDGRRGSSKDVEGGVVAEELSKDETKGVLLERPTCTEAEDEEELDGVFTLSLQANQ